MDFSLAGRVIEVARTNKKLSRDELGVLLNVSRSTVYRLEHGQVSRQEDYYLAAKVLKIDLDTEIKQVEEVENLDHFMRVLRLTTDVNPEIIDYVGNSVEHQAYVLAYQSKLLLKRNEFKKALKEGVNAKKFIQKHLPAVENTNLLSYVYNVTSNARFYTEDLNGSLEDINKAINVFNHSGKNSKLFYMLRVNRCIYLEHLGLFSLAYADIDYLYKNKQDITNITVLIQVIGMKAIAERSRQQKEAALQIAFEGQDLASENRDFDQNCFITTLIARIYSDLKKWDMANDYFSLALLHKTKVSDPTLIAEVHIYQGSMFIICGKKAQARTCFENAINICRENSYTGFRYVKALICLARCLSSDIEQLLLEAASLAEQGKLSNELEKVYMLLSDYYADRDEKKFLQYAKDYIKMRSKNAEVFPT